MCSINIHVFNWTFPRALRGDIEEVDEILSRVEKLKIKPQEPCKPVREPQPPKKNRVFVVAPRTLQTPSGGSSVAKCPNGDDTSFNSLDVRIKQGTIKPRLVSPEILTLEASRGKTCQPKPKAMQIKATQLKLPARSKQVKFCHLTI